MQMDVFQMKKMLKVFFHIKKYIKIFELKTSKN